MKKPHIQILACCVSLMLIPSCDRTKKDTSRTTEDNKACVGSWVSNGSHPLGYSYGKYTILLNLEPDGTCKMTAQYDLNKSPMSDKFSDIVHLNGSWKIKDDKVQAALKVTSWVVTDLADYRKEETFDDFVTDYNFKMDNGRLIPVDKYSSSDIKIGTTEEAREMDKLIHKGKGIMLVNAGFHKK